MRIYTRMYEQCDEGRESMCKQACARVQKRVYQKGYAAGAGFEETGPDSMEAMEEARTFIWRWGGGLTIILLIVWPVMALPPGVFDKGYFYFWVILSIIWGLVRITSH